jgi:hypothetical protein
MTTHVDNDLLLTSVEKLFDAHNAKPTAFSFLAEVRTQTDAERDDRRQLIFNSMFSLQRVTMLENCCYATMLRV